MDELIPGYDALGIEVEAGDDQKFERLLRSLWLVSRHYPCQDGECGAVSGDYFRVWTRISSEGMAQVLESNPMPGMVCHLESFEEDNRAKLWMWDPQDPDAQEPVMPLCVRTPLAWFPGNAGGFDRQFSVAITLLARDAEFFDDEAALKSHPALGKFAPMSVIPTGLLDAESGDVKPAKDMAPAALEAVLEEDQE